jgi:CubicO group peptidase (beta-lactamase class C family)
MIFHFQVEKGEVWSAFQLKKQIAILILSFFIASGVLPLSAAAETTYQGAIGFDTQNGKNSVMLSADYWPTDGWVNATPEDHGMDSEKLQDAANHIEDESLPIQFLLIIKDGYLVFERYFNSYYKPDKKENLWSGSRGVTGILFGMALDKGLIDNITQPIIDFFPEITIANLTPWKERITIENLLTMTSGFEWDEITLAYDTPGNSFTEMINSDNWAEYVLNLDVVHEPGTQWNFCAGDSHLLSCIFTRETGMSLYDFAVDNLFNPLNITNVSWSTEEYGLTNGGSGLQMTPHDLAKFGYLMLNNGTWNTTQIVSKYWVQTATSPKIQVTDELSYGFDTYYGYHWWIHAGRNVSFMHRLPEARNVYLIPKHNLVVVMSAGAVQEPYPQGDLLYNYILAALKITEGGAFSPLVYLLLIGGGVGVIVVVVAVVIFLR